LKAGSGVTQGRQYRQGRSAAYDFLLTFHSSHMICWLELLTASFESCMECKMPQHGWSPEHANLTTSHQSCGIYTGFRLPADKYQIAMLVNCAVYKWLYYYYYYYYGPIS